MNTTRCGNLLCSTILSSNYQLFTISLLFKKCHIIVWTSSICLKYSNCKPSSWTGCILQYCIGVAGTSRRFCAICWTLANLPTSLPPDDCLTQTDHPHLLGWRFFTSLLITNIWQSDHRRQWRGLFRLRYLSLSLIKFIEGVFKTLGNFMMMWRRWDRWSWSLLALPETSSGFWCLNKWAKHMWEWEEPKFPNWRRSSCQSIAI